MRKILTAAALLTLTAEPAAAQAFEWVNGKVTSITAQLPDYTTAAVGGKHVRFCDPASGKDYAVTADNVHYDMLFTALQTGRSVQVGVRNFGMDARAGSVKLCIDRVIY